LGKEWQLIISDMLGRSYQKRITISGDKSVEIDISELPNGIYFTEVASNEKAIFIGKFIKI